VLGLRWLLPTISVPSQVKTSFAVPPENSSLSSSAACRSVWLLSVPPMSPQSTVMASPQIGLNRLTNAERFHPNAKVNPFLQEYPCQPVPDDATSTVALDSVDVLPHEHKEDAPMRHSTSLIAKRLISTSVLTAAAVLALPAITDA